MASCSNSDEYCWAGEPKLSEMESHGDSSFRLGAAISDESFSLSSQSNDAFRSQSNGFENE